MISPDNDNPIDHSVADTRDKENTPFIQCSQESEIICPENGKKSSWSWTLAN